MSGGFINYAFPNLGEGRYTNEVYGTVSIDTILQPSFAVYGDMHNGNGMYYNFGISHSVPLGESVGLNLSASLGVNQGQWIDVTAVSDVMLGVSLDIPLGDAVTFSPFYNYITGNERFADMRWLLLLHRINRWSEFELQLLSRKVLSSSV